MESFKKYSAELVGTFLLVFFGCGTACLVGMTGIGYLLTALAFGLALLAASYGVGGISGGHFNPAVSLAMLLLRKMSFIDCVGYMAAQYIGGIGGSALLYAIFRNSAFNDLTGNLAANTVNGGIWVALIVETVLTCALVLAVIGVSKSEKCESLRGVVSGTALALVYILGIGFTGASANPARSLGCALFVRGEALKNLWVFFAAPAVGALLAALLWILFEKKMPAHTGIHAES